MKLEQLRKFCIKNHRIMWNWLADNPDKNKEDWPGWEMNYDDLFSGGEQNFCFLCGYVSNTPEGECFNCPLDWGVSETCVPNSAPNNTEPESYFELYCDAKTEKETSKYARIIANLPEIQEIDAELRLK